MENEQNMPVRDMCKDCGKDGCCGKHCCGGWWQHKKMWKRHGRGGCQGGLWFVGWLFTVGFLKLAFWKGVLALVIWPYYLGSFFAR